MCSFCVSKTKSQNLSFFSFIFSFFIILLVLVLVLVSVRHSQHSSVSSAFSGMLLYAVASLSKSSGGQSEWESDFFRLLLALSLWISDFFARSASISFQKSCI
nr:MAG TPA: hypothetical protein [Caudoviricetes sp.]